MQTEPDATGPSAHDFPLSPLPDEYYATRRRGAALNPEDFIEPKPAEPCDNSIERSGHSGFLASLEDLRALHILKSGGYGTGADPFANFTAVAAVTGRARYEYPIERIVEKVTRLRSLIDQGRTTELAEEYGDIAGLALCGLAMLREDEADH